MKRKEKNKKNIKKKKKRERRQSAFTFITSRVILPVSKKHKCKYF